MLAGFPEHENIELFLARYTLRFFAIKGQRKLDTSGEHIPFRHDEQRLVNKTICITRVVIEFERVHFSQMQAALVEFEVFCGVNCFFQLPARHGWGPNKQRMTFTNHPMIAQWIIARVNQMVVANFHQFRLFFTNFLEFAMSHRQVWSRSFASF